MRCTDVVCFVLFVAVWVAAIAVGFFGYFKGDPDRITHGYDFQGNACGVGSNALFPFVYFPIPGLVHYSVCVQACPALYDSAMCAKTVAQGDTICNQGPLPPVQVMKCLSNFTKLALSGGSLANAGFCFPTYPTNDFFNRCLPLSNSTTITVGSPPVILQDFNKISSSAQLTFQFESGELVNGKYLIIACAALSLGLAIVYSFFLRFSTGPVVWLTIVLVFFLLLGIGSLLLFKAGLLNSAFLTNEFPSYPTATVSYTSDQKTALEACGAISIALAIAELVVLCMYRGSITLAIKAIEEAARAFESLPGLVLLPFIQLALYAVGIFWFIFSFIYLASSGSFDAELGSFQISKSLGELILLEAFVLIWSHLFVHACGQISISGAVSEWYFDKASSSHGSVFAALQRTLRFHVGTAAFGSLIVSVVEVLRCVVSFYVNRTKRLNKESAVFKLLSCCAECCMGILERLAHFASEMAYIQTAMHGTNFCSSASSSFGLASRNSMNIIALSGISGAIMLIGKLFIAFGTTLASIFIFNGGKDLFTNTKQFQSIPCLVVFVLSYVIASFFLGVLETCIDTIFQCFCEDSERHSGRFTDPSLQKMNSAAAIRFGLSPYSPQGNASAPVAYSRMNDDKRVFI